MTSLYIDAIISKTIQMKKLGLLLLLAIGMTTLSHSQVIRTIEMSKSAYNNAGDTLHHVANDFSDSVGILLKKYYPARIRNVFVEISFDEKSELFTLSYYAEIESCMVNERDWFFEHAGALSANGSITTAKKDAFTRMKAQEMERKSKFKAAFGNCGSAGGYHYDSAESYGKHWVIYETFIVAR